MAVYKLLPLKKLEVVYMCIEADDGIAPYRIATTCASANHISVLTDFRLYMLFKSTEMNIQFMQVLKERSEGSACGHLGKRIHILRETLAVIAKLAVRSENVSMGVVDVAGKQHTSITVHQSAPICSQYSRQALK